MSWRLWALLTIAGSACNPRSDISMGFAGTDPAQGTSCAVLDVTSLTFDAQDAQAQIVTLINEEDCEFPMPMVFDAAQLDDPTQAFAIDQYESMELQPGEQVDIAVRFVHATPGQYEGQLEVLFTNSFGAANILRAQLYADAGAN